MTRLLFVGIIDAGRGSVRRRRRHWAKLRRFDIRYADHGVGQLNVALLRERIQDAHRERVGGAAPLADLAQIPQRQADAILVLRLRGVASDEAFYIRYKAGSFLHPLLDVPFAGYIQSVVVLETASVRLPGEAVRGSRSRAGS